MKIMNEKGKLFGLINVIDLFFLLAVIAMVFVVSTKLGGKAGFEKKATVNYDIEVKVKGVLPEIAEKLEVGDVMLENSVNKKVGTVKSIEKVEAEKEVTTADGEIKLAKVPGRYDIKVTLEGSAIFDKTRGLLIGSKDFQIGNSIIIKSKSVIFVGNVSNLEIKE
ncbi:MAG: DUF4330 domain-containing protein [Clostridia bacterium]|jgi:hypothetical protein|nr:DUF4330 domain-containing protein [Clostridia bacterium]